MAHPQGRTTFPGVGQVIGAEMTLSRGVTPSVCTLLCVPQDNLSLGEGTLEFHYDGQAMVSLPGCLPSRPYLRRDMRGKRQIWSLQVLDRRWKWKGRRITGRYNLRLPNGTVAVNYQAEPAEMAAALFGALGETNFDVSRMPTGVYPLAVWDGADAQRELQELLEYVACCLCLDANGNVVVYPYGTGGDLPPTGNLAKGYRMPLPIKPSSVVVVGGPSVFQSSILLEAVGRDTDNSIRLIEQLSYKPQDGWDADWPLGFPNVVAASRVHALETVYRWFRIKRLTATLPSAVPLAKIQQILPLNGYLLDTYVDSDGGSLPLPAYVMGRYWQMGDADDGTESGVARYPGRFEIDTERGIVRFAEPVTRIVEDAWAEPVLYLNTTHRLLAADGSDFDRLSAATPLGGPGGPLHLSRPEVFGSAGNGANTFGQAQAELQRYASIFAAKFNDLNYLEKEYNGILSLAPDGIIAQVRYSTGNGRPATTRASRVAECDIYAPPVEHERRAVNVDAVATGPTR